MNVYHEIKESPDYSVLCLTSISEALWESWVSFNSIFFLEMQMLTIFSIWTQVKSSLPFLPCCDRTTTENFQDFLFLEERKDEHNIGREIYNKITLVIIISNF